MSKHATRPRGTMLKAAVDPLELAKEAGEGELRKAMEYARRLAYSIFGHDVTPYIGQESQAGRYPPWQRVFVEVPGLPPLNFIEGSDKPNCFAIGVDCPSCGSWVSRTFYTPPFLAQILVAPVVTCSECLKLGRLTEVRLHESETALPRLK